MVVTAETITEEQIKDLRKSAQVVLYELQEAKKRLATLEAMEGTAMSALIATGVALQIVADPSWGTVEQARTRCAEILNQKALKSV